MSRLDSKATTYLPFRNLKYLKAFTSLWNEICDITIFNFLHYVKSMFDDVLISTKYILK